MPTGDVFTVLEGLIVLYRQLGGVGTFITLLIMVIFIGASYANVLVRRKYISLSEELAGYCAGDLKAFSSSMLRWIDEEYREAARSGLSGINTLSIIQTGMEIFLKPCILAERLLKKTNGLLITTGLFGTFIGLTYAVGNMGNIMSNTSTDTLMRETGADILVLLVSSFQGMAVAFVTSLFGTGFSILFMIISSLFSAAGAKDLLVAQLEEYLDVKAASEAMEELRLKGRKDEEQVQKTTRVLNDAIRTFEKVVSDSQKALGASGTSTRISPPILTGYRLAPGFSQVPGQDFRNPLRKQRKDRQMRGDAGICLGRNTGRKPSAGKHGIGHLPAKAQPG